MRRKAASLFLGLAVLGFTAACSATADTRTDSRTASPVVCEIALDAIPGGTRVSGIVTADRAIAGTYEMAIRAPSASIRQGGDFEARPGQRVTIAETELVGPARASRSSSPSAMAASARAAARPRCNARADPSLQRGPAPDFQHPDLSRRTADICKGPDP